MREIVFDREIKIRVERERGGPLKLQLEVPSLLVQGVLKEADKLCSMARYLPGMPTLAKFIKHVEHVQTVVRDEMMG